MSNMEPFHTSWYDELDYVEKYCQPDCPDQEASAEKERVLLDQQQVARDIDGLKRSIAANRAQRCLLAVTCEGPLIFDKVDSNGQIVPVAYCTGEGSHTASP